MLLYVVTIAFFIAKVNSSIKKRGVKDNAFGGGEAECRGYLFFRGFVIYFSACSQFFLRFTNIGRWSSLWFIRN